MMRIGLDAQNTPAVTNEKIKKSSASSANSVPASQLQGTQDSSDVHVSLSALATRAMETPEVRQDKIDALRQSITSGQYQMDPNESAEAMLSF